LLAGYSIELTSTVNLAGTTSSTVPRGIGRVNANGNIDTSTALTDASNAGNPRSAVSTNGVDLWETGSTGGVHYATLGATTSITVSTTVLNLRQVNVYSGQLYVSDNSGSTVRLGAVGGGTPTP